MDLSGSLSPQGSAEAVEGQSGPREVTACAGAALRVGGCLLKVPGMSLTQTTLFKRVQMCSDKPESSGRKQRGASCLAGLTETVPRSVSVWASWVSVGPQAGRDQARSCPQPRLGCPQPQPYVA